MDAQRGSWQWTSVFLKEAVTPVWYKRSSYLIILGIIALIVIITVYDLLFPSTPPPNPPIVAP